MLKKDYIQRYLDELTKMIAVVLQLKQNNEPELADIKIDEFANNFLNISLNKAKVIFRDLPQANISDTEK